MTDLFQAVIEKFQNDTGNRLDHMKNLEFFNELSTGIKGLTGSDLSAETLYKQYYLRLQNHNSPEIGYSTHHLNALSKYLTGDDYVKNYSIVLATGDEVPEFPYEPFIPCFPSTPSIHIKHGDFENLWIKDESINPTGTHKDRLAWELYLHYNNQIKERMELSGRLKLPRCSIISSGNAAIAVQYLFYRNGLPNLKVIIDEQTDSETIERLEKAGCELFPIDLESKKLSEEEILAITKNEDGIDLTEGNKIADLKITFYDWLSFEVLNLNPKHVFIPYGTGDMYRNILEIWHQEFNKKENSRRFFGNKNLLKECNYYGAFSDRRNTVYKMLYSPYSLYDKSDLDSIFNSGIIGEKSQLLEVKEEFAEQALELAKTNGINCEYSGAAGIALFLQMKHQLNPKDKILIINTGKIKTHLFND